VNHERKNHIHIHTRHVTDIRHDVYMADDRRTGSGRYGRPSIALTSNVADTERSGLPKSSTQRKNATWTDECLALSCRTRAARVAAIKVSRWRTFFLVDRPSDSARKQMDEPRRRPATGAAQQTASPASPANQTIGLAEELQIAHDSHR
jgi:hypothetical protein